MCTDKTVKTVWPRVHVDVVRSFLLSDEVPLSLNLFLDSIFCASSRGFQLQTLNLLCRGDCEVKNLLTPETRVDEV